MSSILVLLALSEHSAHAANIRVPGTRPTLQAAIDNSTATDVIILTAELTENVVLTNATRTIRAEVPGTVFNGSILLAGTSNLTISDVHLQGGEDETDLLRIQLGNLCVSRTGGIDVGANSTLTMDNVEMSCFPTAISVDGGTLDITGSEFRYSDNSAIHAIDSTVTIRSSSFELNSAADGGAIYAIEEENLGSGTLHVQTSTFLNNSANGGEGGGIYTNVRDLNIWANEFNNNYNFVFFTPGLDLDAALQLGLDISGVLVGLGHGAGLYIDENSVNVDVWNNTFCGNIADIGAGMYLNNVGDAAIYNNRFAENWAAHYGGGFYVEAGADFANPVRVINNTLLYNTAGRLPPPNDNVIVAIGGGGGGAFVNTIADFRNNIVSLTKYGAGLLGVAQDLGISLEGEDGDYTIGDLLRIDYNDFYHNCDVLGCDPQDGVDFSGDLSQISLPSTNIQLEPFPVYFEGGEFNCLPDAFYPEWGSPVVRSGDAGQEPNQFDTNFSDMGAYGGPRAEVLDRDHDGYENIYDCNDEPGGASVHPEAPEGCDGFDNDCDGLIDEGFETDWYEDADGDGYGDVNQVQPLTQCTPPPNHVLTRDDCDDGDDTVSPGTPEKCDGIDNDCNGAVDDGLQLLPLYPDNDEDNYGAILPTGANANGCVAQDENAGPGAYYVVQADGSMELTVGRYVENGVDCNDADPNVNPDVPDICDTIDNNCDEVVDEGGGDPYYPDGDGDGFGDKDADGDQIRNACQDPGAGWSPNADDCDDSDPAINPDADEVCDEKDNDCVGGADKNAIDAPVVFEDLDGDKLGNPTRPNIDCVPPAGYTATVGTDCDDNDADVKECVECGCQTTSPGSVTALGALVVLGVALRRRRR